MSLDFFRRLPVKRKLTLIVLVTCSVVLLLTCAGLFGFQVFLFRKSFQSELANLAEVVANNLTGTIAFGDKKAAEEILSALTAHPQIDSARIQLTDGRELARAAHQDARNGNDDLLFAQPIVFKGETIGTLHVRANVRTMYRKWLALYAVMLALVLGGSFLIALPLSARLQRFITDPILKLAGTARIIAERHDYSVRAEKLGDDEFGLFTDAFNQMLARIESQNTAMRESESRYRMIFQRSPLPKWVYDLHTHHYLAVNDAAVAHYGYNEAEFFTMTIDDVRPPEDGPDRLEAGRAADQKAQSGQALRHRKKDGSIIEVELTSDRIEFRGEPANLVIAVDVTERKHAEAELQRVNKQLLETSRYAGMAEVATGVLHNVGNVLNSVNVSASLAQDFIRQPTVGHLIASAGLLREHTEDMGAFLTTDPRGRMLPGFITKVADQISAERQEMLKELSALTRNVEHIKEIVAMQQTYARVSGLIEPLAPVSLVEDALRINESGLLRHGARIVREFDQVSDVAVDKHKLLQILINLIGNAKYAISAAPTPDKRVTLRIRQPMSDRVQIQIVDNGIGIPPENLTRIFSHGFTTKKDGHGFGLHSGANAATEMGGQLTVQSDGPGCGATFTLELPVAPSQQINKTTYAIN